MIGIGNAFLNKDSRLLRYLSQASFTVYVVHMLVNTAVGYFIIQLKIGVGLKYLLIVIITFILCFILYEMIKRVRVLRFLFAIKANKKADRTPSNQNRSQEAKEV